MKTPPELPLVPREEFCALYRKLRFWWGMRHIEESAFILGIHLLQKMVKMDSLEVPGTWSEFAGQVVCRGEDVIAGPICHSLYMHLGAMQQLHSVVGIFSHVNQDGIEQAKQEARVSPFISQHFTKTAGADIGLIGEETPMLFVYTSWAGYDVDKTWENYLKGGRRAQLPTWLTAPTKTKG